MHRNQADPPASRRGPKISFWTFDAEQPSFRHRHRPLIQRLSERGWHCRVEVLPRSSYFRRILQQRRELRSTEILVLAKTRLGLGEPLLLPRRPTRIVFDFDDAVYVRKARRCDTDPDGSRLRRLKFAHTCGIADLVLAGNPLLADIARPHARWIETVPTSVPLPPRLVKRPHRTLVWIGMPENLKYLELIHEPLADLQRLYPDLKLRVISSRAPAWPDVSVEWVPWSERIEDVALGSADIGLMPLTDDSWSRGKCAFKLLQYMANGLPSVASPVGTNRTVVQQGVNGFLAESSHDWFRALRRLLDDPPLRQEMGQRGRAFVRASYERQTVIDRVASLFERLLWKVPARRSGLAPVLPEAPVLAPGRIFPAHPSRGERS